MGTTVRRINGIGGDRTVIHNRFTHGPSMEVNERQLTRAAAQHSSAFKARFPMLDSVDMAYRWGGQLCVARNNVQVIKPLDDGLFAACCQNGLGTAKGSFAGLNAAELATDQTNTSPATPLPTRLSPAPIAQIGATLRLRWTEMRAGKER